MVCHMHMPIGPEEQEEMNQNTVDVEESYPLQKCVQVSLMVDTVKKNLLHGDGCGPVALISRLNRLKSRLLA